MQKYLIVWQPNTWVGRLPMSFTSVLWASWDSCY